MKKLSFKASKLVKKAFTITELVIVIAVIAVLAAVLIPTFSNVIESANKSAALQTCRNALVDYNASANEQSKETGSTVFVNDDYVFVYYNGSLHYVNKLKNIESIKLSEIVNETEQTEIKIKEIHETVKNDLLHVHYQPTLNNSEFIVSYNYENNKKIETITIDGLSASGIEIYNSNSDKITTFITGYNYSDNNSNAIKKPAIDENDKTINESDDNKFLFKVSKDERKLEEDENLYFYRVNINEKEYVGFFTLEHEMTGETIEREIQGAVYSRVSGIIPLS